MSGVAIAPCAHIMRLETPNGPTVCGVCRKCGFVKEYPVIPEAKRTPERQPRDEVGLYLSEKRKTEK